MEGKKTRTLEIHKGAAPKVKSVQKRGRPRDPISKRLVACKLPTPSSVGRFAKVCCILIIGLGSAAHPDNGVCGVEIFSTFHKMMNAFKGRLSSRKANWCPQGTNSSWIFMWEKMAGTSRRVLRMACIESV